MALNHFDRLPAPHDDVQFSAPPGGYYVEYVGSRDALIAAGAIEPYMALGARKANRNTDDNGLYWTRVWHANCKVKILRSASNGLCVVSDDAEGIASRVQQLRAFGRLP